MKWWIILLIILTTLLLPGTVFGAGGYQVVNVDGKISISADNITLGHLLDLWDKATGMHSTAAPELAGRTLNVHFTGLSEDDAVRAIFLGQPFGYGFVHGEGIVVTAHPVVSRVADAQPGPPPVAAPPDVGAIRAVPELQNPAVQRMKPEPAAPEQPVTITPSPFGPIVSPAGSEPPVFQLPPVPGAPPPPPFFRPDVPAYTPSGSPNGTVHDMLFDPLSVHP
jgi:hypothetical protein